MCRSGCQLMGPVNRHSYWCPTEHRSPLGRIRQTRGTKCSHPNTLSTDSQRKLKHPSQWTHLLLTEETSSIVINNQSPTQQNHLPGSSPTKLPTMKSSPAKSSTSSSKNCSFTTHLTPATLMTLSSSTAPVAKPRMAHLLFSNPTSPAIDSPKPSTLSAQPTACPKQYNNPKEPPNREPSVCAIKKYTPPLSTRHRSQMPTAARTLISANVTVARIIKIPLKMPACATTQPDRRNTITPKMLIMTDVKTPSQVPNNIGCEMKKFVRHQGLSPWSSAKISFAPDAWWPPAAYWYSLPKSTKPLEFPRGLARL